MPKPAPEDPKNCESLLVTFGTLGLGIDPDEIVELLDQSDERHGRGRLSTLVIIR